MSIEPRDIDTREEEMISLFVETGCGCQLYKKGPCIGAFTTDHIKTTRNSCAELDKESLDMLVLGHIVAMNVSSDLKKTTSKERLRSSSAYFHQGIKV